MERACLFVCSEGPEKESVAPQLPLLLLKIPREKMAKERDFCPSPLMMARTPLFCGSLIVRGFSLTIPLPFYNLHCSSTFPPHNSLQMLFIFTSRGLGGVRSTPSAASRTITRASWLSWFKAAAFQIRRSEGLGGLFWGKKHSLLTQNQGFFSNISLRKKVAEEACLGFRNVARNCLNLACNHCRLQPPNKMNEPGCWKWVEW